MFKFNMKNLLLGTLLLFLSCSLFTYVSIDVPKCVVKDLIKAKRSLNMQGKDVPFHISLAVVNNPNEGNTPKAVEKAVKRTIIKFGKKSLQVGTTGKNKYFGFDNKCIVHEIAKDGDIMKFQDVLYQELVKVGVSIFPLFARDKYSPHITLLNRIQKSGNWPTYKIYNNTRKLKFSVNQVKVDCGDVRMFNLNSKKFLPKKAKK